MTKRARRGGLVVSTGLGLASLAAAWQLVPAWPSRLHASWPALTGYVAIVAAYHCLRAWRWRVLVEGLVPSPSSSPAELSSSPSSLWSHLSIAWIGFAWIVLLPLRLGEFVRPALLSGRQGVPFVRASSSIVVERIADAAVVAGVFLLAVTPPPPGDDWVASASVGLWQGARLLATAMLLAALGLTLAAAAPQRTAGLVVRPLRTWAPKLADRLAAVVDEASTGLSALTSWRSLAAFLTLTIIYWSLNAAGMWQLAQASGIILSPRGAAGLMAVLGLTLLLPAAPAQAGPFHLGIVLGLALTCDIPPPDDVASSYVTCCYVAQLGVIAIAGVVGHIALGLGWRPLPPSR